MARSSAIGTDDFARYCESADRTEEGPTIGHLKYHPTVYREARRYMSDHLLVASANLETCIKPLTAQLPAERFCDGHLQSVLKSGHITAILRRLERLKGARLTKAG